VVPRAEFAQFLETHPEFAHHFIKKLIQRIRTLTHKVRSLALMDAYGRVARLLLESSVKQDGLRFVPERLTQAEMASRVGCSREMVSRIFSDLTEGGYVGKEAGGMVILRKPPARW
jgi:CRP/FNR family cyclic AMP-dependent transcriptional regulator